MRKTISFQVEDGLRADDPRFNQDVVINFEDGSFAFFNFAFYEIIKKNIIVYTEHCGYHQIHRSSIERIRIVHFEDKEH